MTQMTISNHLKPSLSSLVWQFQLYNETLSRLSHLFIHVLGSHWNQLASICAIICLRCWKTIRQVFTFLTHTPTHAHTYIHNVYIYNSLSWVWLLNCFKSFPVLGLARAPAFHFPPRWHRGHQRGNHQTIISPIWRSKLPSFYLDWINGIWRIWIEHVTPLIFEI